MNRRDAINRVGLLLGGTIIGADLFLSGCKSNTGKVSDLFAKDHVAFMNEIADTILPPTKTPGAKAANVGQFMAVIVQDCYTPADQEIFMKGLDKVNEASQDKFSKKFMDGSPKQRTEVLTDLDKEQKEYTQTKKKEDPHHYFRMMKELTLLGYFTSEVGCTSALRYLPVPGRYDGNMAYKKGDRAWALV
jgi:hypothetical protein